MNAIFSIAERRGGFRETGTEGRSVLHDATRRKILNRAAAMQRRWQGRAVRVEEFSGSVYAEPSRVWTYHCACDLDRPCAFHAGEGA